MRRAPLALAAALAALAGAPAAHAQSEDGGTQIGGSVSSTLSLDLAQTGSTVRAVVTTTEPGSALSVAPADDRAGLSAAVSGPYAPLDPTFGLGLQAWDDVLAGRATTVRLKSASSAGATVLITLSATYP
jgi:hypothetical protein